MIVWRADSFGAINSSILFDCTYSILAFRTIEDRCFPRFLPVPGSMPSIYRFQFDVFLSEIIKRETPVLGRLIFKVPKELISPGPMSGATFSGERRLFLSFSSTHPENFLSIFLSLSFAVEIFYSNSDSD